jgi:predicted flap endonuclease-1-like 5' DNA nuclease
MLYLASQFVWFLAAAFALGLVMGWIGQDGSPLRPGRGAGWLATLWAVGAGLTWLQLLNGVAAVWVETALLFTAVYVAGCVVGALLSGAGASTENASESAVATLPPVPGEADIPGQRPAGLVAAREAGPDDLKLIRGIGRQNEDRLQALGIWHFTQIAAWTPANVEWVGSYLAFPGRIEREDWVGQAKTLAEGGETEFAVRARAGLVESSRDEDEPAKA